jgi:D-beta-D-heptose 7-phosphate kinase/D-beta-D-heptose 1-phosphate adenosyltransferase
MSNTLDFKNVKVLIIGDVMLDTYYTGGVERISPEAPIPVVKVNEIRHTLGGAGNVANNVVTLGAVAGLIGCAGNDFNRSLLDDLMESRAIKSHLVDIDSPTVTKSRIIAGNQQIVRMDFEHINDLTKEQISKLETLIRNESLHYDIFVLSDYGKCCCHPAICRFCINLAHEQGKQIIIDPKGFDWEKYRGADIVTPNISELGDVVKLKIRNEDSAVVKNGENIRRQYDIQKLLVTRSEKGMTFITNKETAHFCSEVREVYDVSGAGDTVVATLAVGLAAGLSWKQAVPLANKAASIVVGKKGTAPIHHDELFSENDIASKIINLSTLPHLIQSLKSKGKQIVFTNGCFDIVHKGHIQSLRQAKSFGDILIVGLNSDESVKRLKGANRPIKNQEERAVILEAFSFVDYIVVFDEDTPLQLLSVIKPHILAKGGDYSVEQVVGREFAGKTVLLSYIDGFSSTKDINKINSLLTDKKQDKKSNPDRDCLQSV